MTYRDEPSTNPGYSSIFRARLLHALKNQIPYTPSYALLLLAMSVVFRSDIVGGWAIMHVVLATVISMLALLVSAIGCVCEPSFRHGEPNRVWHLSALFAAIFSIASATQLADDTRPDPVRMWTNCRVLPAHVHEKAR